jgi:choline-glycine betaine transporter
LFTGAVYLTVAVSTALASFRFKLPLTFRSGFYPILGEYTWGWMGDVIDGFSIVVTVAGVCTSLGLGAIQISTGLQRIGWVDPDLTADEKVNVQTATIWIITCIATISVMTGLDVGIKYLSIFAFSLGMILTFVIFIMDRSNYLLNLMVQTFGYYFQSSIWQLPFHTDAFGQLREGEGRAVDGAAAAAWWLDAWTIFYVSGWITSDWEVCWYLPLSHILLNLPLLSNSGTGGLAGHALWGFSLPEFLVDEQFLRLSFTLCWFP